MYRVECHDRSNTAHPGRITCRPGWNVYYTADPADALLVADAMQENGEKDVTVRGPDGKVIYRPVADMWS